MDTMEFREIVNNDCSRILERGLQVCLRFVDSMYHNFLARHVPCESNRNFTFSGAIDEKFMTLCPLCDGSTEEGFACVRDF
jgi:hypothetical protein